MSPEPEPALTPELDVRCAEEGCATAVGLLVVSRSGEPERCTAALVGPDVVLTASHCLPEALRFQGSECAGVWVGFPSVGDGPPEWVECAEVDGARPLPRLTPLQQDLAKLRLRRVPSRAPVNVTPTDLEPGDIVTVVSVDPHPIYATQHQLRAHLCRVGDPEVAAERLEREEAAAVGWLADCNIVPGNSGSAVLDREGRLRAIVHGGSGPYYQIGVTSRPAL